MDTGIAWLVCAAFMVLALWHVGMAFGSSDRESGAVPSVDGKPLFRPSRASTLVVALALLVFALLVAGAAGIVPLGVSKRLLSWPCYALALGLFARAIGEFRYVGFFKRVRGSRFARLDTLVYSPLCLLLALGVLLVATKETT